MAHRLRLHPADATPHSWVVASGTRYAFWVALMLSCACDRPGDIVGRI
ncbi:MAG: hypothetical protein RJA70_2083, partial [Pseudomonadota bacterium]